MKNGILDFNDTATFFKDVEILSKMSDEEFRSFEKSIGIKSLSNSLEESYAAFDELKTKSDLKRWEVKYGDIVEIRDSIVPPLVL